MNQIERHPVLQSKELVKYCASKGIHITAYSAFGNNPFDLPLLVKHPEIVAVAESVSKKTGSPVSGAQVILAWSQIGEHSVIPKSVTPSRIRENFQEIELDESQIAKIDAIGNVPRRFNTPLATYKPRWNIDIFGEKEEKNAKHAVILTLWG